MKSAGLDPASLPNNPAPAPPASSPPITTAKTARLAKYSRTCRRSGMKRRTTDPATRSPANAYTNGASAAADIRGRDEARKESLSGPSWTMGMINRSQSAAYVDSEVLAKRQVSGPPALGKTQGSADERRNLASDADDLRLAAFHFHADLNPARMMHLHSLLDDEGRGRQFSIRREVGTAGAGGASRGRVLNPEIGHKAARVDRRIRRDGLEGERVTHDLLSELRQDLAKRAEVWIRALPGPRRRRSRSKGVPQTGSLRPA